MRQVRPFILELGDPRDRTWRSVHPDRTIKALQGFSLGFAEETIGFIEYEDGTFEVGIGESLRPYISKYSGTDVQLASATLVKTLFDLAFEELCSSCAAALTEADREARHCTQCGKVLL